MQTKFNESRARFSPDGHWIAYSSNESGTDQIFVQSFPPSGGKWQVSVNGGNQASWRQDGKELFFDTPDGKLMAVDVKLGSTFEAGIPRALFDIPAPFVGRYVVNPDGQRFLFPFTATPAEGVTLTVVLNWTADLK